MVTCYDYKNERYNVMWSVITNAESVSGRSHNQLNLLLRSPWSAEKGQKKSKKLMVINL